MNTFVIYTPFVTERLQYVLDFICSTRNVHWQITNDRQQFIQQDSAAKFNYSNETFSKCFPQINPAPVLLEDGVKAYQIEKVRFGNDECMSFDGHVDPLASIFYVLSRYEEYLTQAKDEHDRFIAQHSLQKK